MELCTLSLKIIYFWSVPNHLVTVNSVTSNMVELPELIEFKSKLLNQMMRYMVLEEVVMIISCYTSSNVITTSDVSAKLSMDL